MSQRLGLLGWELGDVVDDAGQELEDIPARLGWKRAAVAPGEKVGDHLLGDEIAAEKYADQDFDRFSGLRWSTPT